MGAGVVHADRARAERAQEALRRAEQLTGARSVRTGPVPAPDAPSRPVPVPGEPTAGVAGRRHALLVTERPPLPVPPGLAPLLPEGLRRGATTAVTGSTSLVLTMLAHACAHGAWAAVVGQPSLGFLAAAQAGVDLHRLAVVPVPGPDAALVVAALLDGIDVVVVGPATALTPADRRLLSARARERGAVLLATCPWPGAAVTLVVEEGRWTGIGAGEGRLRAHRLRVGRVGRGAAGASSAVELTLGGPEPAGPPEPVGHERRTDGLRLVG